MQEVFKEIEVDIQKKQDEQNKEITKLEEIISNGFAQMSNRFSSTENRLDKSDVAIDSVNKQIEQGVLCLQNRTIDDFEQTKKDKDDALSQLFDSLRKEKREAAARSRKERAHELITIGALTEVTNFEKDRGLIAGVLLDALERFSQNESLRFDLKKRGDALLHQIEVENKAKKSKE